MSMITDTLKYYPEFAKRGWCFCGNRHYADEIDVENTLSFMSYAAPVALHEAINMPAYWQSGHCDPHMFPIFVQVTKPELLISLGCINPGPVPDLFSSKVIKKESINLIESRFDILDI